MVETGYIFTGQGAQFVGMGQDLYDKHPAARQVFDKADEVLDFKVTEACFNGPEEHLKKTDICQPAILTTSLAALEVLKAEAGDKIKPIVSAGLSLGEYASLVACGALDLEGALKLVYLRGKYMQEACDQNPGTMASVIGLEASKVEDICRQTEVEIANLNCPGQVVISGSLEGIERAIEAARQAGAKKVIPLVVAGAFHSRLMDPASDKLAPDIEQTVIKEPVFRHVANISAQYVGSADEIKRALVEQVNHTTRWSDSINLISGDGIKIFLEIGPGKVLKGLLRRIDPELQVHNIDTMESIEKTLESIG